MKKYLDILVNSEDLCKVAPYSWHVCLFKGRKYLARSIYKAGHSRKVYLHRDLVDAPVGTHVHHLNGDTLDNRKQNLLVCTKGQHSQIEAMKRGKTSKYLGVWREGYRWRACACVRGRKIHLGSFADEIQAANARREFDFAQGA